MNTREFIELCRALDQGERRQVKHFRQHEEGIAMVCDRCRIEVEVGGRRKSWPMEACEERSASKA